MDVTRSRFPRSFVPLLAILALAVCDAPRGEGVGEEAAEAVRQAIAGSIQARGDRISLGFPGRPEAEPVELAFDHVHEGVERTPGGRYVACVDFRDADGTIYDVDYYVAGEDGGFRVEDVVLHLVGEEEVIPDTTRARLESEG